MEVIGVEEVGVIGGRMFREGRKWMCFDGMEGMEWEG